MEVRERYGRVEEESRGTERAGRRAARELSRLTGRLGVGGRDYAWIGQAQSGDQSPSVW